MSLMRWNPFRELERAADQLTRRRTDWPWSSELGGEMLAGVDWTPTVDIKETKEEFIIKAELPGVDKTDVKVEVRDDILFLRGERKEEKKIEGEKLHRVERFYGHFERSFRVPGNTDPTRVKAEFNNGLLSVHLPKVRKEEKKPTEVKID